MSNLSVLLKIVRPVGETADWDYQYWMLHNAGDEARSFCHKCGEKRRLELMKELGPDNPDYDNLDRLDGGKWLDYVESDSAEECAMCGKQLMYTLTKEGVSYEAEGVAEGGCDLTNPRCAFQMALLIECAGCECMEKEVYEILQKSGKFPMLVGPFEERTEEAEEWFNDHFGTKGVGE